MDIHLPLISLTQELHPLFQQHWFLLAIFEQIQVWLKILSKQRVNCFEMHLSCLQNWQQRGAKCVLWCFIWFTKVKFDAFYLLPTAKNDLINSVFWTVPSGLIRRPLSMSDVLIHLGFAINFKIRNKVNSYKLLMNNAH